MLQRAARDAGVCMPAVPVGCSMLALTPHLKLQPFRRGAYKYPKLAEACAALGVQQGREHDALSDARACAACFVEARKRGWV